MKKYILLCFIILALAIVLPNAKACFDIQITKPSYFPQETFQAEITGSFVRKIDSSNIAFYKDSGKVDVPFTITQLASNKFFVYAELPVNYGQYVFSAEKVLCLENKILREKTISKNFEVKKPLYLAFSWLSGDVLNWPADAGENAMIMLALSYDSSIFNKGREILLNKKNITDNCWYNVSCKVKATALALVALSSNETTWLLNSQNSIKRGLWDFTAESKNNTQCNLTIPQQKQSITINGSKTISLYLPDDSSVDIGLICDNMDYITSAKVSNTFMGTVEVFPLVKVYSDLKASLNNQKCWGEYHRSDCDAKATAYALWALRELGQSMNDDETKKAIDWLKESAKTSQNTMETAFAYLFTEDSSLRDWLLNNQAKQGYWASDALTISQTPDTLSTIIATFALAESKNPETSAIMKSKNWLKDQYNQKGNFGSIFETSFALYKIFPTDIEPILSVSPAIIKTRADDNFTINMKNNGLLDITVNATADNAETKMLKIPKGSSRNVIFSVSSSAQNITLSEIKIDYRTELPGKTTEVYSYSVPLMIFPKKTEIAEIENIVNSTVITQTQLTETNIEFTQNKINKNISAGSKAIYELTLKNPSEKTLYNITISYDYSLQGVFEKIEPLIISELAPLGQETIKITVNTADSVGGIYSGDITAKSGTYTATIPFYLDVQMQGGTVTGKKCSEYDGKICATEENCTGETVDTTDGICCLEECVLKANETTQPVEKPSEKKVIGGILIISVILIIAAVLYFKLKKHEQKSADVLEKIEEKYRQRY